MNHINLRLFVFLFWMRFECCYCNIWKVGVKRSCIGRKSITNTHIILYLQYIVKITMVFEYKYFTIEQFPCDCCESLLLNLLNQLSLAQLLTLFGWTLKFWLGTACWAFLLVFGNLTGLLALPLRGKLPVNSAQIVKHQ